MENTKKISSRFELGKLFLSGAQTGRVAWLFYFSLLLFLTLPFGADTVIDQRDGIKLSPLGTNSEIMRFYGLEDFASYARGGRHWVEKNYTFEEKSYINMWAPGMFWIHAAILKAGENSPAVLVFILLSCLVWSAVLYEAFNIVFENMQRTLISIILPLSLFVLPQFRLTTLTSNVLGSESLGIGTFMLGLIFLIKSNQGQSVRFRNATLAGALFSISAYMRAFCEITVRFSFIFFLSFCVGHCLYRIFKGKKLSTNPPRNPFVSPLLKKIGLAMGVFFLLTLPWRLHHVPSWVNAPYVHAQSWMSDNDLRKSGAGFVVDGGGNASACKIDKDFCAKVQEEIRQGLDRDPRYIRQLGKKTTEVIIRHPFQWAYYKMPFLGSFWFKEGNKMAPSITMIQNTVLFLFLTILMVYNFRNINQEAIIALFFIGCIFFTTITLTFVIHFEARYLYMAKIIPIYLLFLLACQTYRPGTLSAHARGFYGKN